MEGISTMSAVRGGLGRSVLVLLVLIGVLLCQVQGQQYDPTDCPPTCRCEHPHRMPVGYLPAVQRDVSNGVFIINCKTDPYNHLIKILQAYPTIDGLQIWHSLDDTAAKAGYITKLITEITTLTSLKLLDISYNKLDVIPNNIGKLSSLQLLGIGDCGLTDLPESLGNLTQLEVLTVHENQFRTLPESIGKLESLVELYANNNSMLELPVGIGYLPSLQILSVYYNDLVKLPESIGNLNSLVELFVDNNRLIELPVSVGYLSSLQEFDVSSNTLIELPESIGNLMSLKWLYAYNNSLRQLPESMGNLATLGTLDISNNHLTTIPTSIVQLPLLINITAHHNNITSVDISSIVSVPHRVVDYSYNQISTLGTIPTTAPNWQTLNLSNNKLTSVDSWFVELGVSPPNTLRDGYKVSLLDVSYNSISRFTYNNGYPSLPNTQNDTIWEVDLSYNNVKYLHYISDSLNITQEEMVLLLIRGHLNLANNPLICDCRDYRIYQIYKGLRLNQNAPSLSCHAPVDLRGLGVTEVEPDQFTCLIKAECPDDCICTDVPSRDLVTIDCRNFTGKTLPLTVPSPWRRTPQFKYTLDFEGGSLVNLGNWDYLNLVENASFSHNHIEEIPAGILDSQKRFNVLKLDNNNIKTLPLYIEKWPAHLYLGHNEWRCSCENYNTIQQIKYNKDRVVDYQNVTCSSPDDFKSKNVNDIFCSETNTKNVLQTDYIIPLIVVCTLLVFIGLTIGIAYAKRVLLYKMFKWHPFQRGDADEAMKEFDVFISYNEDDFAYIEDDILPKLQEFGFKVCHHREHFLAGESIIGNIHNAIMNSKKTLVFFSKAYMESGLCMHEFHTALTLQVKERCIRLVTIKDTDLDIKTLETGMQSFFQHYTYIERDSRQFWDNLLYILPEKRMNAKKKGNENNAAHNANEFETVVP